MTLASIPIFSRGHRELVSVDPIQIDHLEVEIRSRKVDKSEASKKSNSNFKNLKSLMSFRGC